MARLSDSFTGVVIKRLSEVETNRDVSNQHEFNGTTQMLQYLGAERRPLPATFIYLGADEDERLALNEEVTWYDAREQHESRSEHRLYFHHNEVMTHARSGDILIAALRRNGSVLLLVVDSQSGDLPAILWLFGASESALAKRLSINPADVADRPLSVSNEVSELIGLDVETDQGDAWLDSLVSRFGGSYPSTRDLSAYALETLINELPVESDPDATLLKLMDREELLFRQLERHIVSQQIAAAAPSWSKDVDAFIHFSLSVHNRRKSRAGHALENHLEWIFHQHRIQFDHGAITEGHSKPDFLFPSAYAYRDDAFPTSSLTMLGAKTTCKDRWRQLLNEAARINAKHLLTLQPAISDNQTDEMRNAQLSLVVPQALHSGYKPNQQKWLLSLQAFIELVRKRSAAHVG